MLYKAGVETIRSMRFEVRLSSLIEEPIAIGRGRRRVRRVGEELNLLLQNPEVRAIVALTGGGPPSVISILSTTTRVRADPKPVIGFGKIDVLHLAVHVGANRQPSKRRALDRCA